MAVRAILCIFNRGCSVAEFLFVLVPVVNLTQPLPVLVDRGGSRGGARFLHVSSY